MFGRKPLDVVFVDDDPEEIRKSVGFSPDIFKRNEFTTMKMFCNKRDIHQRHLNALFKRYLGSDQAYIRDFRVRTLDTKDCFADMSKLYQEIAEIYIPTIFQKEYVGLLNGTSEGQSMEQVTFPRFLIMSYIFCAQPISDLIFDFIAILRQRFDLKISAIMFAYNFEQMVLVLMEELKPSATRTYLIKMLHKLRMDEELSVGSIITMGIKYPLLFYHLKRFRVHFRRIVLGDRFWSERKLLRSQLHRDLSLKKGYDASFANENAAKKVTSIALMRDVLYHVENGLDIRLTDALYTPLKSIDNNSCNVLKVTLGFQLARNLILESELSYPAEDQEFLSPKYLSTGPGQERIHDQLSGEECVYDVASGKRAWIQQYVSPEDDRVLKEREIMTVSHMAFEQATTEDD